MMIKRMSMVAIVLGGLHILTGSIDAKLIRRGRQAPKGRLIISKQAGQARRKKYPAKVVKAPPKKVVVAKKPSQLYTFGQQQGVAMIEILSSDTKTPNEDLVAHFSKQEHSQYTDLSKKLFQGTPGTEEYKKQFAQMTEFWRGLKNTLSQYKPVESDDIDVQRRNLAAKVQLLGADSWLASEDHKAWQKSINAQMVELKDEFARLNPNPSNGRHPAFNKGYLAGKRICDILVNTPQKEKESQEDADKRNRFMKDAHKKEVDEFFETLATSTPDEKRDAIRNFFLGMEGALDEFSPDEAFKDLPKEKADLLKKEYEKALKSVEEGYTSVSTDEKQPA